MWEAYRHGVCEARKCNRAGRAESVTGSPRERGKEREVHPRDRWSSVVHGTHAYDPSDCEIEYEWAGCRDILRG